MYLAQLGALIAEHLDHMFLGACREIDSSVDGRMCPKSFGRVWKSLKVVGPSVGDLRRPTVCECNGGIPAEDGVVPSIIGFGEVRR
jgi:hypothetical protein